MLLKGKPLYDFMDEFPILQEKNKDPAWSHLGILPGHLLKKDNVIWCGKSIECVFRDDFGRIT
jgi:hypothetical protein